MKRSLSVVVLLFVVGVLVERIVFYFPFLSDDALISLRYADRLLDGKGLTWTDGERVEGYTDLAWVLLTAMLGALKVDLIVAARALGIVGALTCVVVPSLTTTRPLHVSAVRALSGSLFMALSAPVAVWAIGALEHGFESGVIVAATFLLMRRDDVSLVSRREHVLLGALFVLLVLLRADGVVCVAALLGGNALRGLLTSTSLRVVLRDNVVLGLPPLAALVAQLGFRRAYYGEWVPNTALVKAGASVARLQLGLAHLEEWSRWAWPLLLASAFAVFVLRKSARKTWLIPVSGAVVWWAYLATMGGDIFPAWRQVLLGLAPLGVLIAEGFEAWWTTRLARVLFTASTALLLSFYGVHQRRDPTNVRASTERWEFEGVSLGPALRAAWSDRAPLLAVDAAGTLPYFSRLPSLDLLGLNDRYIAMHPPPVRGLLSTGHELGDGAYTWSRKPDILAFCGGMGGRSPCFLGGKQMLAIPEFGLMYQLMRYHTPGPPDLRGELWLRREDSVLGVERGADRIRVPAWLLTETGGVTELHEGRFRAVVSAFDPAHVERLRVPAGRWRVTVESEDTATLGVLCAGRSTERDSLGSLVLEFATPREVGLLVGSRDKPAQVDGVVFERTRDEVTARCGDELGTLVASTLTTVVPNGAYFHQPEGALLLRGAPVRVKLAASHGGRFEASLDANDAYRLRALRGNDVLLDTRLPIQPGVGGLFTRTFEIPADSEFVELTPEDGDSLSGLGHFIEVK